MRANLTYGSRWQGMETRIGCGQLRHSQRKRRANRLPDLSLRRHPLTLPPDAAPLRFAAQVKRKPSGGGFV
jgi:hypothetical protein